MISLPAILCVLCALVCGQVTGQLSDAVKKAFVDAHNTYRAKVASGSQAGQPSAANMEAVIWNDDVAAFVQAYMDSTVCAGLVHNDARKSKGYGENAWGGMAAPPTTDAIKIQYAQDAVKLWFDEVSLYTYPNEYSTDIGHYLQVVWANAAQIGCGYSTCSSNNDTRIFCNYSPSGNYPGQPPYVSGAKCSKCPSYRNQCTADGLCYSTTNTIPRVQCYQQTGYGQPVSAVTCPPWFNACGMLSWTGGQNLQASCVVKGATTCTDAGDTFGSPSQWCTCNGNLCNPITV